MIADNRFSVNLFIQFIVFLVSNALSVEFVNKTDFYNNYNNSFAQYMLQFMNNKNEKLIELQNNSDNAFIEPILYNNETLSDSPLNSSQESYESQESLILTHILDENDDSSEGNVSASESRTLSSWLGLRPFRRPQIKLKPILASAPSRPQPQAIHPVIVPQILPQFLTRPNSFPGPHDPDSVLLSPSLFEESGVKYWLKFIENAGKDDTISGEPNPRPVSAHEGSRMRRPTKYVPSTAVRPMAIRDKPMDETDEEYYEESEESDDQNDEDVVDEPKSSGSSSTQSKQTYDTTPRCDKFTSDICVDDFEYPEQAIVDEIYKRRDLFDMMYSEVRDNTPLVDGIPRDVEESYSNDYYYNDKKDPQTSSSEFNGNEKKKLSSGRGFVCPTEVLYGKPKLARNKRGEWKVIVNAGEFTQTVRMEKCLRPNSKCNYISYPDFNSRCAQVHSYHRLLVFEKGKGFYIDTFRMPTACTCHVTRKVTYKPLKTASNELHKKQKPSPQLSNTLWSILGGALPNDDSANLSPSQDMIRNQMNLLQHLKHLPQLSHISPENVFQQLMDFQSSNEGAYQSVHTSQKGYQMPQKSGPIGYGQSNYDYILPAIMVNEAPTSSVGKHHSQSGQPLAQIHQSSGTTTLLNPNVNGAPVVQVIHVPVTSAVAPNSDPAPVYKGNPNQPMNDYSYLDTSSLFYKPKGHSDEFLQTFSDELSNINVDNFKPLLLGMSSKTNSSLMSPNADKGSPKRESDYVDNWKYIRNGGDSDETNKKRKVMVESTLNKKINFSYHPILEYIST